MLLVLPRDSFFCVCFFGGAQGVMNIKAMGTKQDIFSQSLDIYFHWFVNRTLSSIIFIQAMNHGAMRLNIIV